MESFIVSPSPHISHKDSVSKIMYSVIFALMPVMAASIYYFKLKAAGVMIAAIIASIATEYIFRKIRKRNSTIKDGSAVITGILLALTLPPTVPIWVAVVGAVAAIGLGKQVYGGLGSNIFNPALVGRAFVLISFPALTKVGAAVDGTASATTGAEQVQQTVSYVNLIMGNTWGTLGEVSAAAVILGALYLIYKKHMDWRVPVSYLGTAAIAAAAAGEDPLQYILTGGVLLGAFFFMGDTVTTPLTRMGRIVVGVIGGILTVIIPGKIDAVMYTVLLMNAITPIVNRYIHHGKRRRVRVNG